MVFAFPGSKGSLAKPAPTKPSDQRSPSFAYALAVSLALSIALWGGLVVLAHHL